MAIPGAVIPPSSLAYLVQGSFYTKDTIGNNPGNGGYKESVKSKGINPKYISRVWAADCLTAQQATASLALGAECTPCGTTQFMRMDVKGSPALRFLNHNAYAIGDSAGICCAEGQEFLENINSFQNPFRRPIAMLVFFIGTVFAIWFGIGACLFTSSH